MKLAILWLLLVSGALALIAGVASYDPGRTDPSIVVVGERGEIAALDLPQLEDATFVSAVDDLPSPIPTVLLLTPGAASNLPDGALQVIARKGVAIGGLNVPIDEIARLNGTLVQRRLLDEALVEAGEQPPLHPEPPLWSFNWISCGIVADHDLTPGTRGAEGTFAGPLGQRPFETAFTQMKSLGEQCAQFDPAHIPLPSYRLVVIGAREETASVAIPELEDALFVATAQDVPPEDVALVLITPSGAEASLQHETEPLTLLRNSGVPIVGLDIDLADVMQMSGTIPAIRGANNEAADDVFADAQWQGQRPVYSYVSRPCPLDDPRREGGQGQAWIGGLGAAPESPPLRTFTMRIEELQEIGANCTMSFDATSRPTSTPFTRKTDTATRTCKLQSTEEGCPSGLREPS